MERGREKRRRWRVGEKIEERSWGESRLRGEDGGGGGSRIRGQDGGGEKKEGRLGYETRNTDTREKGCHPPFKPPFLILCFSPLSPSFAPLKTTTVS